jgi:Adenylate and Guanylate cyclase catalytic domain
MFVIVFAGKQTMNTAARMEHNGERDKIQLSQETADLLIAAGKTSWLSQRADLVYAKGKGEMQTYWLELSARGADSSSAVGGSSSGGSEVGESPYAENSQGVKGIYDAKTLRLIEWNVDVLLRLLKQIVSRRRACPIPASERVQPDETRFTKENCYTLDEVKEIITLPKFRDIANHEDPENVSLDPIVVQQLHDYVCNIAAVYRDNPFHNFEHVRLTMCIYGAGVTWLPYDHERMLTIAHFLSLSRRRHTLRCPS